MKQTAIVTEGKFDTAVLQKLLEGRTPDQDYEIYTSSGYSSALSTVRSLLSVSDKRIVLLLDTDTTDNEGIEEQKQFVKEYVPTYGNPGRFKTVWAIPELEIIFLNNKKFLSQLTPTDLSPELIEIGKGSPKRTLQLISGKTREEYLSLLDAEEIRNEFFKEGPVKEIYDFIEEA